MIESELASGAARLVILAPIAAPQNRLADIGVGEWGLVSPAMPLSRRLVPLLLA